MYQTSLSQGVSKRKNGRTPNTKLGHLSLPDKPRGDRLTRSTGLVARFIRDNNLIYCYVSQRKLGYPTEIYLIGRIDRCSIFQWVQIERLHLGGSSRQGDDILEIYRNDELIVDRPETENSGRGGILKSTQYSVNGKIYTCRQLLTQNNFLLRLGLDPNEVEKFEASLEKQGYKIPKNRSLRRTSKLTTKRLKDKRKSLYKKVAIR